MRYWGCSVDRENRFSRRFFFCPKSRPWTLSRFLGENCSTFHFPGKKSRTPLKFPSDFGQFSLYGKRDSLPFFFKFHFFLFLLEFGQKSFFDRSKKGDEGRHFELNFFSFLHFLSQNSGSKKSATYNGTGADEVFKPKWATVAIQEREKKVMICKSVPFILGTFSSL